MVIAFSVNKRGSLVFSVNKQGSLAFSVAGDRLKLWRHATRKGSSKMDLAGKRSEIRTFTKAVARGPGNYTDLAGRGERYSPDVALAYKS